MSHKLRTNPLEDTRQGDDPFWKEHYPKLQRYCHFLTQNTWDGDDIAQETYLKALKYQQKMSSALLNKIAYHHWIDMLRKRKHETIDSEIDGQTSISRTDETVELLLKQFTPKQAVIFLLKEAFQYQLKEIADILGTTEMAVKSNLHRAKKRLEKDKGEEQSFSVDTFWNEEEKELLTNLFKDSLQNEDPSVLIKAIPTLQGINVEPKLEMRNVPPIPFQANTPSSTLYMAA
ncbi:sigma-70 family RNA polymerase sigma factor [Neobacillus pocheonensis]|uniref:sigma-70 family RNA polymerase sigma factor n=1 Tax=Neobacillus pocheonensis TaxID=363869 RepID=UPI003D2DAE2F